MTEATVNRMLALQEQRLALDIKQAEAAAQESAQNAKIADKSIDAHAADRKDARQAYKSVERQRLVFAGVIVFAVLGFCLGALYMGQGTIVMDLVKITFGFLGGYGVKSLAKKNGSKDED